MVQTLQYLSKEVNWVLGQWEEAVDLAGKIKVLMLMNGASSDQTKTPTDQSSISFRNPTGINTKLDLASNMRQCITPKTSNASAPPGIPAT
eukprot:3706691-Ditylum_brightwellii.AAC.1